MGEYALIRRFMPDGTPDPSFGEGGLVSTALTAEEPDVWHDVDFNLDGRIAAVTGGTVARFEPDGDPDPTFGEGGVSPNPRAELASRCAGGRRRGSRGKPLRSHPTLFRGGSGAPQGGR